MARFLLFILLICSSALAQSTQPATQPSFHVGRIADPAIPESSGVVESRKHPGVFWTHNDSGNPPQIFAIDPAGQTLAAFRVDAKNNDWEDLATDAAGHLYLADTGNNNGKRKTVNIFQLEEPDPNAKPGAQPPGDLKVTQTWQLAYPGKPFDCESFFVWEKTGYVISKHRNATPAGLYRFPLEPQTAPATLEKVADLPIRLPVTSADISRDGKQVAVLTVGGPSLFTLAAPGDLASITQHPPRSVFFTSPTMEAVTFTDNGLLVIDEKRPIYLFRWKDFGPVRP